MALALVSSCGRVAVGADDAPPPPDRFSLMLKVAGAAYEREDMAEVRRQLRTALMWACPDHVQRRLLFASQVYDNGQHRRARLELKKAIQMLNPWFWVILGLVGQISFTARFVVQWLASERKGESVIPLAFWYFSLGGSTLLLIYAIWRQDPVFILGLSLTSFVYIRNLMLIFRKRAREAAAAEGAGE
jgi:lipid-A-disaccharide synthase-like uncharacterized protein